MYATGSTGCNALWTYDASAESKQQILAPQQFNSWIVHLLAVSTARQYFIFVSVGDTIGSLTIGPTAGNDAVRNWRLPSGKIILYRKIFSRSRFYCCFAMSRPIIHLKPALLHGQTQSTPPIAASRYGKTQSMAARAK